MPDIMPTNEIPSDDVLLSDNMLNDMPDVEISSRYKLPPRSTQGVPSKRYDPEYEALQSRYPINRGNGESLSQTALAFNTTLYTSALPKNVEETLQDPKWKKVMEEEMLALKKNEI